MKYRYHLVPHLDAELDAQCHACEREAILVSLDNLEGFPWVSKKMKSGELHIHGWHFSIADALLQVYEPEKGILQLLGDKFA